MRIALFGKNFDENFTSHFGLMLDYFDKHQVKVDVYKPFYDFLSQKVNFKFQFEDFYNNHHDLNQNIDFVFSIGGDGTFLNAINIVRNANIPIVGINSGRLGFMADIAQHEIPLALKEIFSGNYSIEERDLLQLKTSKKSPFHDFNYALNEFTVHKTDSSSMLSIHTYLDNEYLNSYWADGLIIATPTGSTAYSLSVGGPILDPNTKNFIISPISPHNLTVRPIVVPNCHKIKLKVEGRSDTYMASLDSRSCTFENSTELTIAKSKFTIKVLKLKNHCFYATLRSKLMWGMDKRN